MSGTVRALGAFFLGALLGAGTLALALEMSSGAPSAPAKTSLATSRAPSAPASAPPAASDREKERLERIEKELATLEATCERMEAAQSRAREAPATTTASVAPAASATVSTTAAAPQPPAVDTNADPKASTDALVQAQALAADWPRSAKEILERLKRTDDAPTAQTLAGQLQQYLAQVTVADIMDALATVKDPTARYYLIYDLMSLHGPDATAAIESLAGTETDPTLKDTLTQTLTRRKAPVEGLLVTSVTPRSRAEAAGIQVGDIITHYNGEAVKTTEDVQDARTGIRLSQTVFVQVYRNGQQLSLPIKGGMLGVTGDPVPEE